MRVDPGHCTVQYTGIVFFLATAKFFFPSYEFWCFLSTERQSVSAQGRGQWWGCGQSPGRVCVCMRVCVCVCVVETWSDVCERGRVWECCCHLAMACLMAAWSIHNPTVTNSIIMVSTEDRRDSNWGQTGNTLWTCSGDTDRIILHRERRQMWDLCHWALTQWRQLRCRTCSVVGN